MKNQPFAGGATLKESPMMSPGFTPMFAGNVLTVPPVRERGPSWPTTMYVNPVTWRKTLNDIVCPANAAAL
jgi:hypothetical protein